MIPWTGPITRILRLQPIDALDPVITVTGDEEPTFDATVRDLGCQRSWCRAWGEQPCRTRSGDVAEQQHKVRGRR